MDRIDGFLRNETALSAKELIELLSPFGETRSREYLFRGVSNSTYQLIPSALRGRRTGSDKLGEYLEVCHFIFHADEAGLPVPKDWHKFMNRKPSNTTFAGTNRMLSMVMSEWPFESWYETIALAQHHGITTRLLDWTRDPYIALYFAALGRREAGDAGEIAVWALNKRYVPSGANLENPRFRLIRVRASISRNIHNQRGVFTVDTASDGPVVPLDEAMHHEHIDIVNSGVVGVVDSGKVDLALPAFKKITYSTDGEDVLRMLRSAGYNAARLFPGFDGAARAVRELSGSR